MARIKHIQRRLENWAIWSSRGAGGGRGFATKSVLASEVWSRGSYNNVPIPVFEEEAAETDKAVSALKLGKGHLFVTLEPSSDVPSAAEDLLVRFTRVWTQERLAA